MALVGKVTKAAVSATRGKGKNYAAKFAKKLAEQSVPLDFAKAATKGAIKAEPKTIDKVFIPKKSIWQKILDFLPKTQGAKGGFSIENKKLLENMVSGLDDPEVKRFAENFLKRARNPKVQVAYKNSKNGPTIAGLRLYDGEAAVGSAAISMTNPGKANNVVKARLSLGNKSEALYASGYVSGSKPITSADEMSITGVKKAGAINATVTVSDRAAVRAQADLKGKEARRVANYLGESKALDNWVAKCENVIQEKVLEPINKIFSVLTTGKA